jgi:hypothetical protein
VDPQGFRNIFPSALESIMYDLPLLLWLDAGYLILLYWYVIGQLVLTSRRVELLKSNGISRLTHLQRFRPVIIGIAIVTAALILPLGLVNAWKNSVVADDLYDAAFCIFFLSVIIFASYYGRQLLQILKGLYNPKQVFMKRVSDCALQLTV